MTTTPSHELPGMTERRFQQQVVKYAELMGWRVWHDAATNQRATCRNCHERLVCATCSTPATIVRNAAGFPDLVLLRKRRLVFAELKSERGRMTPDQLAVFSALHDADCEMYIWRPSDFQKIERILR